MIMYKRAYILFVLFISIAAWGQTKSPKRGLCVDQGKTNTADFAALAPGVSWFYDWGTSTNIDYDPSGIIFVPMTWNTGYNKNDLTSFLDKHPEVEYLLAFNEPNFRSQSNATPSQAAAAWPALEQIADKYNLKLVSPAPNWCGDCVKEGSTTYYSPYQWLADFFSKCPDCRVDYIGIHFYMGDKNAVKGSIDSLWNQFHKPIWLTEFNMDKNGMGDNGTVDEQRAFMVNLIDWMEQDPHVFRYSWFLTRGGITPDLMTSTRGQLSLLGNVYAHMSSYDSTYWHSVDTRIEAEHYIRMSNVSLVASTDVDGNLSVGYTGAGSQLSYQVELPATGDYDLVFRTAGEQNTSVTILSDGSALSTLSIPSSGGWTKWQNVTKKLNLPQGKHTLTLAINSGSCDFNWMQINSLLPADLLETMAPWEVHKFIYNGNQLIQVNNNVYTVQGSTIY